MPDSEPNPEKTAEGPRNLPAVVQQGEVLRPAADNWLLRAIRTLFGWKAGSVRDDLKVVLDATRPEDVGFSVIERTMLRNILSLHERRIADVMVPRADIVAVKRDIPLGELMTLFESAAHSRLVVYNETLDDPEGMVHIRDLLAFVTARARVSEQARTRRKKPFPAGLDLRTVDLALPLSEASITRKLLYVPPSMRAIDLLAQMQASRVHLALVVDEYGGTDGLVSIEDIAEQLVGEIDDEHDSEATVAIEESPEGWRVRGDAHVDEVSRTVGWDLPEGDYETMAGLVIAEFVGLPEVGDTVTIEIDPDPSTLLEDDEAPPRTVRATVLEVDKRVPALLSMSVAHNDNNPGEKSPDDRNPGEKSPEDRNRGEKKNPAENGEESDNG